MQSDRVEEWQRLTGYYGELSDEALLELAAGFGDLTEVAQQVLRDEMKKRGLSLPGSSPHRDRAAVFGKAAGGLGSREKPEEESDVRPTIEYTWKVPLCECDDAMHAKQLSEALKRAGIESWIEGSESSWSGGQPRIVVAADQLEQAQAVAAQPISQDIVDELNTPAEDFVAPRCPKCGAEDPVLESVEPVNTWACEACGAQWADPLGG